VAAARVEILANSQHVRIVRSGPAGPGRRALELSAWQVARARYVTYVAGVALPYVVRSRPVSRSFLTAR